MTRRESGHSCPMPHAPCPMPHASCLMPHASCPCLMPHALCLMPHASCPYLIIRAPACLGTRHSELGTLLGTPFPSPGVMDRMRTVKRSFLTLALLLLSAVGYLAMFPVGQQPDRTFDARVANPAYGSHHPLALFDEGHYDAHSLSGGFAPFRELLRNDGYRVEATTERFSTRGLARADVLVIVNAAGGSNP